MADTKHTPGRAGFDAAVMAIKAGEAEAKALCAEERARRPFPEEGLTA